MHSNYYDMEWTWAYDMLEEYYGVNLSSISAAQIVDLVRRWQDSVIGLDNLLYTAVKEHIVVKKALGDELIERMERLF